MKSKTFVILCAVFIVLLFLALIKKTGKPAVPTAEQWADIINFSVDTSGVTECLVSLGEKKIHFMKSGDKWVVENHYGAAADHLKLSAFFLKLDQLQGELRSDDQDLLKDYGIGDDQAVEIYLRTGTEDITLLTGAKKTSDGKNFVRRKGAHAVYAVDVDILGELGFWGEVNADDFQIEPWADKDVVSVDSAAVRGVVIKENGQTQVGLVLKQDDEQKAWATTREYPFSIDAVKVNNFVQTISQLKANKIVSADEEGGGYAASAWYLTLTLSDDKEIIIQRGNKDEEGNHYYVKASDKPNAFLIPLLSLQNIEKSDGDFFVDNPLAVAEDNLTGLKFSDTEGNREIQLLKSQKDPHEGAMADTGPPNIIWESPAGEIYKTEDVRGLLEKIRQISLKTPVEMTRSMATDLVIDFIENEVTRVYEFTPSVPINDNLVCHYMRGQGDAYSTCVFKEEITALKEILTTLENNKTQNQEDKPVEKEAIEEQEATEDTQSAH